jgi:hypothetical protein
MSHLLEIAQKLKLLLIFPFQPTDLNRPFSKTFGEEVATTDKSMPPVTDNNDPQALQSAIPLAPTGIQTHLKRPVYNPRALAAKKRAEKDNLLKMVELHRRKTELYTKVSLVPSF